MKTLELLDKYARAFHKKDWNTCGDMLDEVLLRTGEDDGKGNETIINWDHMPVRLQKTTFYSPRTCAKCSSVEVEVTYVPDTSSGTLTHQLDCLCTCGYQWSTPCDDAEVEKNEETVNGKG
jgi:hypothetical protein